MRAVVAFATPGSLATAVPNVQSVTTTILCVRTATRRSYAMDTVHVWRMERARAIQASRTTTLSCPPTRAAVVK